MTTGSWYFGATGSGWTQWSNPGSAFGTGADAEYASWATLAKNTTASGCWGTYNFTGSMASTDTVGSVIVIPRFKLSTNVSIIGVLGLQYTTNSGATWSTEVTNPDEPTTDTDWTVDITNTTPGSPWNVGKLKAGSFYIKLNATIGNDATLFTFYVDRIPVNVFWTGSTGGAPSLNMVCHGVEF